MIKSKLTRFALIALAGAALTANSAKAAVVTFDNGDLVLGFRSGASSVYQFNLGLATSFRDNSNVGFIANINTDLEAAFGAGWFSDATLFWGIAGVKSNINSDPVVNGDAAQTIYLSKARTNLVTGSTAPSVTLQSQRAASATSIMGMQNVFNTQTATTTPASLGRGAEVAKSVVGDWSEYVGGTDFIALPDIEQNMGAVSNGSFAGVSNVEGALDVYRLLNPASGSSTGTLETTFVIRQNGDIYAIPEPSTYALLGMSGLAIAFFVRRRNQNLKA